MTPRTNRIVRGGFLALIIVVGVAVVWTVKPRPEEPASQPTPGVSADPGDPEAAPSLAPARSGELEFKRFKADKLVFRLVASKMVGKKEEETQLEKVTLTFAYVAQQQPGTGTIVADRCTYNKAQDRALFEGHVHMTTEDGFELNTESLLYKGDKGVGRGDQACTFKHKGLAGSSTGFLYDSQKEKIELMADVVLDLENEGRPPTHIVSDRAVFASEAGNPRFMSDTEEEGAAQAGDVLRFLGSVQVTQAQDLLKCQRLVVYLSGKERAMYRATAAEDVDLFTQSGQMMPGAATSGAAGAGGPRRLLCRKLDLWYRPDHSLERAAAGPDADLTMLPGPKEPAEKRQLKAKILNFAFDPQGRLEELRGQRNTSFLAEAIPPATGTPRSLECENFTATVDPVTGEASRIQFSTGVHFSQGSREARSERARYDGQSAVLTLRDNPQLVDKTQGSDLKAETIEVATKSSDVNAHKGVRHELQALKGSSGGLFSQKDAPALVTSLHFHYDAATHTARYWDQAVLRAGDDMVQASEIQIQDEGGKRKLVAMGGVTSKLAPHASAGKTPAAVEAKAKDMIYDQAKGQIVYTGDVKIHQGDIVTKSPRATLLLGPDGSSLKSMVVGEPVEVEMSARRATGRTGTFYPETETMTLEGDDVVFKDPGREVHGRILTFHSGDERILVDGADVARPEIIFHPESPKP